MTAQLSRRSLSGARAPDPVRLLHLGLGPFHRGHAAWFTHRAGDGWGIAAMARPGGEPVERLRAQDNLFTVLVPAPAGEAGDAGSCEVVQSLAAVSGPAEVTVVAAAARPEVGVVTVTAPEAGYHLDPLRRRLDRADPEVAADAAGRRPPRTMPGWVLLGLDTRRRAGGGPIAVVCCDRRARNGDLLRSIVLELADMADPSLACWIEATVAFPNSVVDRVVLEPTAADRRAVVARTGLADDAVLVAGRHAEWVIEDAFPAGRPHWEAAGARLVADVTADEERNLRLAGASLSALAYLGLPHGVADAAAAMALPGMAGEIEQLLAEAAAGLGQPQPAGYVTGLLGRLGDPAASPRLEPAARNGSVKLLDRLVPTVLAARRRGEIPQVATKVLAAWFVHASGVGPAPLADVRAPELRFAATGRVRGAVPRLLRMLDGSLADDTELCEAATGAVVALRGQLGVAARNEARRSG